MDVNSIIEALQNAKLYEAAKMQVQTSNIDNLSMLVAVATGKALRTMELYEVYTELQD
jgi:hypothetical protein